jgi:hypothetical protein
MGAVLGPGGRYSLLRPRYRLIWRRAGRPHSTNGLAAWQGLAYTDCYTLHSEVALS